jgi:ParB/RepB/Spo0J family partition protein
MSRDILLCLIDPDPEQPRQHFAPDALDELAGSMAESGLAVPILVRPIGERFVIVHGERRWRAAQSLGWETIPAILRDLDPETARWLALVENVQRADLTPLEEAFAFKGFLDSGITQRELGRRIGKSQSYIAHKLRLLTLPSPLASYLVSGALSEGHIRALLRLRNLYGADDAGNEPHRALREYPDGLGLDFSERGNVVALMRDIRPEDNPPCWIGLSGDRPITPALTAGCEAFDGWIRGRAAGPSWAVAAFWWGSCAAYIGLSVADLTLALDRWRERIVGAMALHLLHDRPEPPADPLRAMEWWGCRSDLHHAGLSDALPAAFDVGAVTSLLSTGSTPLPSALQAWGFQNEAYRALADESEPIPDDLNDGPLAEQAPALMGGAG